MCLHCDIPPLTLTRRQALTLLGSAALYLAAVKKAGEAAAEHQLSLRYGHLSLALFAGYAMDRSFERMEPSLGFPDS